jgi:anti-anti-sigma factor
MNTNRHNGTLSVHGLRELNSTNAQAFHALVVEAVGKDLRSIEIDLSQTNAVDGAGLGALVSIYEEATQYDTSDKLVLRLKNPTPAVEQMLELVRLHHLFEITISPERHTSS